MDGVLRECSRKLGRGAVRSLHLNDSQTPLGSNRDRHANVGAGELGRSGCAAFLSAPSLQKLPCMLETPGENREGPSREEVALGNAPARRRAWLRAADRALGRGGGLQRRQRVFELSAQRRRVLHAKGLAEPQPARARARVDVEHDLGRCPGSPRSRA